MNKNGNRRAPAEAILAACNAGWRHPMSVRRTYAQIERENEILRGQLASVRGCGSEGLTQHDPPPCGHPSLQRDCIECSREDARRCAYWETVAKDQRDEARDFIEYKGLWNAWERWLSGRRPREVPAGAGGVATRKPLLTTREVRVLLGATEL